MVSQSRRTVLRAGAVLGAVSTSAAFAWPRPRQPGQTGVTTFVTVSGSSSGPSTFSDLALRGHRAVSVALPGHDQGAGQFALDYQAPQNLDSLRTRRSPLAGVGLDDFVAATIDVIRRVSSYGPVVLYGGSLGGATLNRVGSEVPQLIDHIVYDVAFCCVDLPSVNDYFATPEGSVSLAPTLAPLLVADPSVIGAARSNFRTADPAALAALRTALMDDAPDEVFFDVLSTLQPDESLTVGAENARVNPKTWGLIPRTYIRHSRDRLVPPALQDRMITEADQATPGRQFTVHTVDAPHAATGAAAERIVEILDGIAR